MRSLSLMFTEKRMDNLPLSAPSGPPPATPATLLPGSVNLFDLAAPPARCTSQFFIAGGSTNSNTSVAEEGWCLDKQLDDAGL